MARRRFFVPEVRRGMAEIAGDEAEHLVRVLRVEPGQLFEISDNQHVYLARVESARKSLVSFEVTEELPVIRPAVSLHLVVALFKFDHFEWLIEKATELGVAAIRPFEAARTDHGLARAAIKRRARWEKIALESSQQARRANLPVIEPVLPFVQAIDRFEGAALLLDELPGGRPVLDAIRKKPARVHLLLGPEGGWTDAERVAAIDKGWQPVSLAPTVLRTETAGIAALAIVSAVAQRHTMVDL